MQEIFLVRQDDRKPLRMKSTAKQENKFNFKRNIYISKMCVDPGPGGLQQYHKVETLRAFTKPNIVRTRFLFNHALYKIFNRAVVVKTTLLHHRSPQTRIATKLAKTY